MSLRSFCMRCPKLLELFWQRTDIFGRGVSWSKWVTGGMPWKGVPGPGLLSLYFSTFCGVRGFTHLLLPLWPFCFTRGSASKKPRKRAESCHTVSQKIDSLPLICSSSVFHILTQSFLIILLEIGSALHLCVTHWANFQLISAWTVCFVC